MEDEKVLQLWKEIAIKEACSDENYRYNNAISQEAIYAREIYCNRHNMEVGEFDTLVYLPLLTEALETIIKENSDE